LGIKTKVRAHINAPYILRQALKRLVLVTILAQSLFALVRTHLVTLVLLTVWHSFLII